MAHPRRADILAELREESTTQALQEIDKLWWELRTEFDAYLDAAEGQTSAMNSAVSMLNSYTSHCTSTFEDIQATYKISARAAKKAHSALEKAWSIVVPKLGLLAAQMSDGNLMERLAASDAEAVDMSSLRLKGKGCEEALEPLFVNAMQKGLWGQTNRQVRAAFVEASMLVDRFIYAGLGVPQDVSDLQDAQRRAEQAMQATENPARSILEALGMKC